VLYNVPGHVRRLNRMIICSESKMRFEENVPENRPCTPEEFKQNALLNLRSSGILATTKVRFKPVISK
jgi:hypothetical protein